MGSRVEFPTERGYSPGREHRGSSPSGTLSSRDQDNVTRQSAARCGEDVTIVRLRGFDWRGGILFYLGLLTAITCLTPPRAAAQLGQAIRGAERLSQPAPNLQPSRKQLPDDSSSTRTSTPIPLTPKQRQSIMQERLERSKSDAVELAALAKELREELNKPKVDILSNEVIYRAERIEKLAKKIRDETRGD